MNNIVGFAHIKKDATTCAGAKNPSEFIGETCAVMEFGVDDCILALNPQGTAMAMFDKEDVNEVMDHAKFPVDTDLFQKMYKELGDWAKAIEDRNIILGIPKHKG